jgi:DNA-binding transcriptional ArsR family regulator
VPRPAPQQQTARETTGELPTDAQVRAAVTSFSMLAEPTRLKLLWLISAEELDVTTLSRRVGVNPSALSQHLSRLRLCGLVQTRKEGRHVLYRARDTHVRALIIEALYHADHQVSGITDHD